MSGSWIYRIRVRGRLDARRDYGFEDMRSRHEGADTVLTGPVADQAALHGLLTRIRDLNLTLLLVERMEPVEDPSDEEIGDREKKEET